MNLDLIIKNASLPDGSVGMDYSLCQWQDSGHRG